MVLVMTITQTTQVGRDFQAMVTAGRQRQWVAGFFQQGT
jgi:hypothetical protein